jgi:hypothetical protein
MEIPTMKYLRSVNGMAGLPVLAGGSTLALNGRQLTIDAAFNAHHLVDPKIFTLRACASDKIAVLLGFPEGLVNRFHTRGVKKTISEKAYLRLRLHPSLIDWRDRGSNDRLSPMPQLPFQTAWFRSSGFQHLKRKARAENTLLLGFYQGGLNRFDTEAVKKTFSRSWKKDLSSPTVKNEESNGSRKHAHRRKRANCCALPCIGRTGYLIRLGRPGKTGPSVSSKMNPKFRVSINSPQSGFMSIGLKFGRKRFLAAMAAKPYASLEELMRALTAILNGATEAVVRWNEEPEEFDFVFRRSGDDVGLEVIRYPSHKRLEGVSEFAAQGTVNEICAPFCQTLCEVKEDLTTDEFARNWRREFPAKEFAELERAIRPTGC